MPKLVYALGFHPRTFHDSNNRDTYSTLWGGAGGSEHILQTVLVRHGQYMQYMAIHGRPQYMAIHVGIAMYRHVDLPIICLFMAIIYR